MKTKTQRYKLLAAFFALLFVMPAFAQRIEFSYPDAWGNNGFNLMRQNQNSVRVIHSIPQLALYDQDVDGTPMKMVEFEGIYLPNNEGAPNLPGNGRYIAIPQGATASLKINAVRKEIVENIDYIPAHQIPLANDDSPFYYIKDMSIYGKDEFYPAEPIRLSEPTQIRGVDVVMLGITPFQYNPITKQLIIYHDIDVEVEFKGGNGHFGEDRLRSRWWDPILQDAILNSSMLPEVDYSARVSSQRTNRPTGFDYIIIIPNDPVFMAWADSIKTFRTRQGITTKIVTTAEIGANNHVQIKNYIANAYNTWNPAPSGVLFLADYGTTGSTITSEYRTDHPYGSSSSYISDLYYGDMNSNHLPDIVTARIVAQNASDLQTIVGKVLNYEKNPPTNVNFYNKPITAMGWQTERWFQLCTEIVNGFWEFSLGKQPLRQNNIYSGTPGTTWSSNPNTSMVVNLFGPSGLGYIPATPAHLNSFGWSANATSLNQAINSGAFMVLHRDHGLETGWGEPVYRVEHLSGLTNQDLTFVYTINCLTGKFNWSNTCFAEAFHRHPKGALGLIAPTEISYSFVNDTYVWGTMDNLWPQFMPSYGTNPASRGIMPAFGNAAGKYFLAQSNWPYNPEHKQITQYLFHHHGDVFTSVYSEMPQLLTVNHMPVLLSGLDYFEVMADAGSLIALSVNGELIGVGQGTGMPVSIPIVSQLPGNNMLVTITKQNYYRYEALLEIIPPSGPYVILSQNVINDQLGNNNGLPDYGETIHLSTAVKNVGLENAVNVTALLSTNSGYITITDNSHIYPLVAPNATVMAENAFAFTISNEIPNNTVVEFVLNMTNGSQSWSNTFYITVYAPAFAVGNLTVSDPTGNNNGYADPGETVNLLISNTNSGNSQVLNAIGNITCSSPFVTINTTSYNIAGLNPNQSSNAVFSITISPNTPIGTPVAINYTVNSGVYTANKSFTIQLGMLYDGFETGNFNTFGWTFTGNQPWTVTNTGAFEGAYAAKSGSITHSQSSQMIIEYDVAVNDSISFYRRVSSENNDYLRFSINGVQAAQWSGTQAWARVSFPVTAGLKTFKWEYVKNASVSGGEDCAWVDFVVFPIRSACPAPRNLSASSVTAYTAQINWAPGGSEGIWDIIWGPNGFNPQTGGTLIQGITGYPYLLQGLSPVTNYQVYVRSKCTDEFSSIWNGPINITTLCATFTMPFSENFGSPSTTCWSFPQGQSNWAFGSSYTPPASQSGAPNAFFNWTPSITNYNFSLTSPLIDATNYVDIKINYFLYLDNYSNATVENMAVEFKELAATDWTLLELFSSTGLGNVAVQFTRTNQAIPGMDGKMFQIRFRAHGANSFNIDGWGLDDILVHGTENQGMPGDSNCDGVVNVLDVITSVNYVTGNNPQPFCFQNADVNGDGNINVLDVIATVNIVTGGTKSSINSQTAHIYLNTNGVQLQSDGTLAGIQFELDGATASQLNFNLPGFEFVTSQREGKLMGMIFSFDNTTIPAGTINLLTFSKEMSGLKWGEVVAGNVNATQVPVIKHQEGDFYMTAYPNPTQGRFIVEVNVPAQSETMIRLNDVTGREISKVYQGILDMGSHRFDLDVALPSGLYFLQIQAVGDDGEATTKQVKLLVAE